MPLQLLKYNPGVVKDITEYASGKSGPFYVDCDLVRFKNGYAEKLGGWLKDIIYGLNPAGSISNTAVPITGIARRMLYWRATDGADRIAVGTHNHLFLIENNGLYDITPLRDTSDKSTTASEALDNSETAIDLVSAAGFTAAGAVIIGSEIITYTSINSLTLTGCTRGTNSTSAATHSSGAKVTQVLINPIATTSGSKTVTITDTAHGGQTDDWVILSGATATGGVAADTLNDYYGHQITVINANSYSVEVPSASNSSVAAGGGLVVKIKYLIGVNAGLGAQSTTPALGFGAGGWGDSTWDTPRSASASNVKLDNSSWNLSLWGEDLIATIRAGAIYYYDTSAVEGSRASLVSAIAGADSVPSVVRVTTVSFPDRHFIAGGCQAYDVGGNGEVDDMLVRWSSQEQFEKFAPTSTNTAGDQRLEVGTKIVAMIAAREETIISSDEAIYGMSFIGGQFVFSFRLLSTNSGAASLNSMISVDGDVFWMGKNGNFYKYDGIVRELPCPVQYFVFDRMKKEFIDKTVVGHNKAFHEVTWFYVSNNSTNSEPESYVTFNYGPEQAWTIGTMDRTVWSDSFGARLVPFAFDPDGFLYNHETGTTDNGAAMNSFIEASPREITAEGENLYMVDQVIPDVKMSANTSLDLYMNTRKYPNSPEIVKGPFPITASTEKLSTRAKGRQIAIKFQSTGTTDQWTLGDFRINSRIDGLR